MKRREQGREQAAKPVSERLFGVLMDQAPVAASVSRGGIGLYANRAWARLFGLGRPEDAVGRSIVEYYALRCREDSRERTRRRQRGLPVPAEFESTGLRSDGTEFPMHVAVGLVQLKDGAANLAFVTDISERKRADAALRRLAGMVASSEDAIVSADLEGVIQSWNPAAERVFGYAADEMLGRNIAVLEPPEVAGEAKRLRERVLRGEQPSRFEVTRRRRDGALIEIATILSPIRGEAGQLAGISAILRDITERKRAEEKLQRSEEFYRSLYENISECIFILDVTPDQRFQVVSFNPAEERAVGMTTAQVAGRFTDDILRTDVAEQVNRNYLRCVEERRVIRYEEVLDLPKGQVPFFTTLIPLAAPDGRIHRIIGLAVEATERQRAQDALEASERRFRALIENSMDLVVVMGADGRFKYSSPSVSRLVGYAPGELRGQDAFGYVHPDDVLRVQAAFGQVLQPATPAIRETFRFRHKDGSWRVLESVVTNLLSEPTVAGIVTNSRDITDRTSAEEALRRSEAEFRGLIERAPIGIYRAAPDGRFLTANPALIRMLGYQWIEEMLTLDLARDVCADDEACDKLAEALAQGEARTEARWKRKDGSVITVQLSVRAVRGPAGEIEGVEGLVQDVTEQRSLETQFRQAQRLEAVGRLAGGVAHDFNNILTAIGGYSELLLETYGASDPRRADLEEIRAGAVRATRLTRQLLAFSRKQILQPRVLDLNEILRALDRMLRRLIGEDIKLEMALDTHLGAVRADPGQIEQVVLNLAVNARDAMPSGGRLTLETATVDLDPAYVREHPEASSGRHAMLAVSDAGVGMDAETRSHLFEPFFTTKEQGKGTGLGLATVYGIVKQSGGHIWVYSEPGRGTTFKIYLPQVDEAPEDLTLPAPVQPAVGGRETVLLAEDDASVRAVVADVLTQRGYRVLRASDGQTALELARGQPGTIHLLLTDLVMPGMTGRELADALAAERPGLRALYMSGYTDDTVVRHRVLEEGMPYLQKPFTGQALASKVREVLDRG